MSATSDPRIAEAVDFIQRNLGGDLRLEALAKRSGISRHHFHRLFLATVGETPRGYLRRLRLEHAAVRLRYTGRPVLELALEAGYQTHEAFTRAFRSTFGTAPSQFRRTARYERARARDGLRASIVRLPERRIACVRHVGPYDRAEDAFERLRAWASRRRLLGRASTLAIYWDDQRITAPEHTRCDAALSIEDGVTGEGEIRVRTLRAGDYAVVCHPGPYRAAELRQTYELLYGWWLPVIGREPADAPPFEVYRAAARPGEWPAGGTRIYAPLSTGRSGPGRTLAWASDVRGERSP